jgi:general secretion pathway protein I
MANSQFSVFSSQFSVFRGGGGARSGAPRQGGFTLLEVVVALAVLATALAAAVQAASVHVDTAGHLRDKTFAHWVGMNVVVEMQSLDEWPETGSENGSTLLAGREWFWTRYVSETPDEDMRRLEVEVRTDPDHEYAIARLTAFLGRPR